MTTPPFGICITGCSHTGKSTLAATLAQKLGIRVVQTDQLARHPGRPWPSPKPQVREFYSALSNDTIFWLLQAHYENFHFQIGSLVNQFAVQNCRFIFEGSALRPAQFKGPPEIELLKICLSAREETLRERIYTSCNWATLRSDDKAIVEAFIARTLQDNFELNRTAQVNGFKLLQIEDQEALEGLIDSLCAS